MVLFFLFSRPTSRQGNIISYYSSNRASRNSHEPCCALCYNNPLY